MPGDRFKHHLMPLAAAALLAPAAGCIPRDRTGFDAAGPSHRLDAVVLAADSDDPESLRGLIQTLDSDDPAARLLAIRALEKRTGQTLGYRYTDMPWQRSQAVDRWVAWEREQSQGSSATPPKPVQPAMSQPAASPSPPNPPHAEGP